MNFSSPSTFIVAIAPRFFRGVPVLLDYELAVVVGSSRTQLRELLGYQCRHFPLGAAFFLPVWEVLQLWPDYEDTPARPFESVAVFTERTWEIVIRLLQAEASTSAEAKPVREWLVHEAAETVEAEPVFGIAPLSDATLSLRPDPSRRLLTSNDLTHQPRILPRSALIFYGTPMAARETRDR